MRKPLPLIEMIHGLVTIFGGMGISARLDLTERKIRRIQNSLNRQRFMLYLFFAMNLGFLAREIWG